MAKFTFEGKAESVRDAQFNPVHQFDFAAAFENGTVQVISSNDWCRGDRCLLFVPWLLMLVLGYPLYPWWISVTLVAFHVL